MTFSEKYNASFGSWAPVLRVINLINLTWPGTKRDQTKMNLAGQCVQRLTRNYFEPWFLCSSLPAMGLLVT